MDDYETVWAVLELIDGHWHLKKGCRNIKIAIEQKRLSKEYSNNKFMIKKGNMTKEEIEKQKVSWEENGFIDFEARTEVPAKKSLNRKREDLFPDIFNDIKDQEIELDLNWNEDDVLKIRFEDEEYSAFRFFSISALEMFIDKLQRRLGFMKKKKAKKEHKLN